MFYVKIDNKKVLGFYITGLHGLELCNQIYADGGIKIDDELHRYIISVGEVEFNGVKEDRIYSIEDKALFEQVVQPVDTTPQPPTLEERLMALESLMMGVI